MVGDHLGVLALWVMDEFDIFADLQRLGSVLEVMRNEGMRYGRGERNE